MPFDSSRLNIKEALRQKLFMGDNAILALPGIRSMYDAAGFPDAVLRDPAGNFSYIYYSGQPVVLSEREPAAITAIFGSDTGITETIDTRLQTRSFSLSIQFYTRADFLDKTNIQQAPITPITSRMRMLKILEDCALEIDYRLVTMDFAHTKLENSAVTLFEMETIDYNVEADQEAAGKVGSVSVNYNVGYSVNYL